MYGDGNHDERGGHISVRRIGRFRVPLDKHNYSSTDRCPSGNRRRPSSAPPSFQFRRACARGRRLTLATNTDTKRNSSKGGQQTPSNCESGRKDLCENKTSIAAVIQEAGRRRKAQPAKGVSKSKAAASAVFSTAPQRPPHKRSAPGPTSYCCPTLDDVARNGKVMGVGSASGRELFSPPPDTPGPAQYAPDIIQGEAVQQTRKARRIAAQRTHLGNTAVTSSAIGGATDEAQPVFPAPPPLQSREAGTFGTSERFPRETARRPGVGEYDLRAAEKANPGGFSLAVAAAGAPYDPSLNRYLRADNVHTPSPHAYRPETASGGGGECGVGGHAPAPPAWSFGGKRRDPRPPDGPGPGRFRPQYRASTPAAKFGVGRAVTSSCVSGVPWAEIEERAARGEGGGKNSNLYLPGRTRMGARAFMNSRLLPRPAFGGNGSRERGRR